MRAIARRAWTWRMLRLRLGRGSSRSHLSCDWLFLPGLGRAVELPYGKRFGFCQGLTTVLALTPTIVAPRDDTDPITRPRRGDGRRTRTTIAPPAAQGQISLGSEH